MFFHYLFIILLGLIFGSFLTSFTYRILKGEVLPKGRSYCPKCKKNIEWYDNIPLLSYLILSSKCRNCSKKIPIRYPLIEFLTALAFVFVFHFRNETILQTLSLGSWNLPLLLLISFLLIAIFIIDFEHQIIPDETSLFLFVISFFSVLAVSSESLYSRLLSGAASALFLLILHIATRGRGMGLGDVKLALGIGILLGWPFVLTWFFLSFVLGSIIGIILISIGRSGFGKHIAFGPFLIISFFIVLVWGDIITKFIMPYLV